MAAPTLTPEQMRYMRERIHENRQPTFIAVVTTFGALCIIFLALRVYCRKLSRRGWGLDDHISVIALIFTLLHEVSCGLALLHGLGRHVIAVPRGSMVGMMKTVFFSQLTYVLGMSTIKFSALLYYRRLFPTEGFKKVVWIVFVYQMAWMITFLVLFIFKCVPVERFWDRSIPGRCINLSVMYFMNGLTNLFSDVVILAMPLPIIWKLNTRLAHKFLLSAIFALGGFACAISIVRLVLVFQINIKSTDPTWDLFDFNLWSPIELAVCYICSCCPTLGPLFTKLASLPSRFTGYGRSKISRITDTDETRELKNMDPSTSTTALAKTHREDHIEVSSYEMHQV